MATTEEQLFQQLASRIQPIPFDPNRPKPNADMSNQLLAKQYTDGVASGSLSDMDRGALRAYNTATQYPTSGLAGVLASREPSLLSGPIQAADLSRPVPGFQPQPGIAKKVMSNLDGMNMDPNLTAYIFGLNNGAMPIKANPTRADLANIYATPATPQPINPARPNPGDSIGGMLQPALTPPPNPFAGLNDNINALSDTVQSLGSAYQNDVGNLNTSVSGLQDQFGTLNTGFTDLQNQVGGFNDQFSSLNTGLSDLQGQFGGFQDQFGSLNTGLTDLQGQFGSLQDSFSNQLNEGIGSITSQFGSLQNDLKGSIENIDNRVDTLETKIDNQPSTNVPQAPQAPQFPYQAQGGYGMGAGYGGFMGGGYQALPSLTPQAPYNGYSAMMGYQTLSPFWLASMGLF